MGPPPAMMNQMRSAGMPPPVAGVNPVPPPGALPAVSGGLAGAPGINPQAIQQALAMRRMRPPAPATMAGSPALAIAPPAPVSPLPAAGMAKGGAVRKADKQWGASDRAPDDLPIKGDRKANGGAIDGDKPVRKADRKWAASDRVAEDLPIKGERKAKGGVLHRRPPKVKAQKKEASVPTPSPYDYESDPAPALLASPPPPPGPGMKKGGKWIGKAIKKPGALHEDLGVAKDKPIPAKKLAKAAKEKGKVGARARLAETLRGLRKNKGGECKDKMAAGGAAKQRKGFPKTLAPLKKAEGGRIRGCGAATKGCNFSGIY